MSSLSDVPPLAPGAVLYTRKTEDRGALARFAEQLRARNWRVGGIVQEILYDKNGVKIGMDAIEVDTGRRVPIGRPTPGQIADGSCALDKSRLAESAGALHRAIDQRLDLIVVEKFGEQEQKNEGLAQEILTAMAGGIPTLVAVPATALEDWNHLSGGLSVLLACEEAALWHWWGPRRLYRDLVLGVADVPVRRVVVGPHWVLVESPAGTGLAPLRGKLTTDTADLAGVSLKTLAEELLNWGPETALGLAAVNAHYNHPGLAENAPELPPLPEPTDDLVTVVGNLPHLTQRLAEDKMLKGRIGEDALPDAAGGWLLPEAEGVIVSSSALADKTLPSIVEAARPAPAALVSVSLLGPATPLTERLYAYGIDRLAGLVITDPDGAAQAVADGAGAGARDLSAFGHTLTLAG